MIDNLCTANDTSQNNGDRNAESPPNPIWFPLWSLIQTEIAQTAPPTALSNSYERELGDHEASWFSQHKAFLSPRKFIMNWRTWQKANIIAISSAHTIDRNGICAVDSRDTHPWFAPTRRARLCIKDGHFSLSCVAIKCRTCSFWKWVKVAFGSILGTSRQILNYHRRLPLSMWNLDLPLWLWGGGPNPCGHILEI